MDETNDKSGTRLTLEGGEPALHWAARVGDVAGIRRLVAAGADVNAVAEIRRESSTEPVLVTPLMLAAGSREGAHAETVRVLLELGADAKAVVGGLSAATFAVDAMVEGLELGVDAARLAVLLEAGCPLAEDRLLVNRMLCEAAGAGDVGVVRLLLAHGVSADGYWDPKRARENYMGRCGPYADVSDKDEAETSTSRNAIREIYEQFASAPWDYQIPLFCAVESGSLECVRALIAAGAHVERRDNGAASAMYHANSVEMIEELRKAGLPLEDSDDLGKSPLGVAARDGVEGIARLRALLATGADTEARDAWGLTVFLLAVQSEARALEPLRVLIAAGADPHAVTEDGLNAFHWAIDGFDALDSEDSVREVLGYLKELGVDIEHMTPGGTTPLSMAIDLGSGLETRVVCELGADPNARFETDGETEDAGCVMPLLCYAVVASRRDTAEKLVALLLAGADVLATTEDGDTPLVLAVDAMCRAADEAAGASERFFAGLSAVRFDAAAGATTREAFVAAALPVVRGYVERFAGEVIGGGKGAEGEEVECVVVLVAYEAWARRVG